MSSSAIRMVSSVPPVPGPLREPEPAQHGQAAHELAVEPVGSDRALQSQGLALELMIARVRLELLQHLGQAGDRAGFAFLVVGHYLAFRRLRGATPSAGSRSISIS